MNKNNILFGLPIERMVYAPEPDAVVLSPDKLAQLCGVDTDIGMARQAAARNIRSARQRHRRLVIAKEQRFAVQLEEHRERLENEHTLQYRQRLSRAIQWMIEEQKLEQHLYEAAMHKAREWALEILKIWGEEANLDEGIFRRVKAMHSRLSKESDLTLTLPPGGTAEMLISQEQSAHAEYRIVIDDLMSPGQAKLGNTLVQVSIDMYQELDDVLMQLRNQPVYTAVCEEHE